MEEQLTISRSLNPSAVSVVKPSASSTPPSRPVRAEGKVTGEVQAGEKLPSHEEKTAVSLSEVEAAVKTLNLQSSLGDRALRFQIEDGTEKIIVSVIDEETGDVIRQIPPEASIKLASQHQGPRGILTNVHG
jgi:flagellar protein FlaG